MKKIFLFIAALFAMNVMASEGALKGVFSVSADKKVVFSQGNLQYQPSTSTYRFATNQYDYVGDDTQGNVYEDGVKSSNENFKRETYTGWGDLFCWGTGDRPWYHSETASEFTTFVDWGAQAISNGGNAANLWRTLTGEEWDYLGKTRPNASTLHCVAKVGDVNCHLLFPDNWTGVDGITLDFTTDECEDNSVTLTQWAELEAAGAVCLPLAGYGQMNIGTISVEEINSEGAYWSATAAPSGNSAWFLQIFSYDKICEIGGSMSKCDGAAVRLVQDAIYKVTIAENEDITVTGCKDNNGNDVDLNAVPAGLEYIDIFFTCAEGMNVEFIDGVDDEEFLEFDNSHVRLKVSRDIELEITTYPIFYSVNLRAEDYSILLPAPQREGERKAPMRFGGGRIIAYLAGTTDEPDDLDLVPHGTKLDIIAQPELGWMFVQWDRIASTSNRLTVTITSDTTITAYFKEAATYTLTMQDDGNGVVTIFNGTPGEEVYTTAAVPVIEGTPIILTAHPNIGYEFDHWDNYTVPVWDEDAEDWIVPTMTGNLTVKAYFRPKGAQPELAEGELPGLFTVGKDDEGNPIRVRFSKGTLQYIAGDGKTHKVADESIAETSSARRGTWQFAENQIDYIGDKNNQAAEDYNKPIDVFCYGASGYDNRYPWLKTTTVLRQDLDSTNYDFGVFNAISNGGNEPGLWRVLNQYEMTALLYTRNDYTHYYGYGRQLHGIGTADDAVGLFLMPDGWVMPGELAKENITFLPLAVENFTTNKYTAAQWAILEQSGVVFIPAGGARYDMGSGTTMYAVGQAVYNQSSTYSEGGMAYAMGAMATVPGEFDGGTIIAPFPAGDGGCSVRLVRDVPTAPEGIETPSVGSKQEATKLIRNGQLLIIRDGKTYNALGVEIK
jgi:hypothetical protein